MKNKILIISAALLLATLSVVIVYNYTFNTTHRNIANEDANVSLSALELRAHFLTDELAATAKYLDKVVALDGAITIIEGNEIILDDRVAVTFTTLDTSQLYAGKMLTIKGRCIGYDELLEMVKIDQALLIDKEN